MPQLLTYSLVVIGLPASLVRLWWIWWQSMCGECGLQHSACVCGPGNDTMRPRR